MKFKLLSMSYEHFELFPNYRIDSSSTQPVKIECYMAYMNFTQNIEFELNYTQNIERD